MGEVDAAGAAFVVRAGDGAVAGPPVPAELVDRAGQDLAGAAEGERRCALGAAIRGMRSERSARWRAVLPTLWRERPAVVYHWLQAEGVPWGATPVLDATGQQCLTPEAVDSAVRSFWVDGILCQHAALDEEACWAAFIASDFGQHLPREAWP